MDKPNERDTHHEAVSFLRIRPLRERELEVSRGATTIICCGPQTRSPGGGLARTDTTISRGTKGTAAFCRWFEELRRMRAALQIHA